MKITDNITLGAKDKLLLIAGPCQIESLDHCLKIAEALLSIQKSLPINLVFKASFDKANRTSIAGIRGPGMEEGLKILEEVKRNTGLPTLTDIHELSQVKPVSEVVDILQTPAFLCRQTDLLIEAGRTGKPINIKKGQFLPPHDMQFSAEKVASTGNTKIMLCERGACFGYRDLIVDMRSLTIMKGLGYPVIFDGTHSVQSMGGAGAKSGGHREFIYPLVRAACAVGIDGLFLETHENPERAPSDGASMLPLDRVEPLIRTACRIRDIQLESK